MAHLNAFRAYRFNPKIVNDLNLVVTQPYDKISPEMQKEYYSRSPYNIVRITKSLEKNADPNTDYSEASSALQHWIDKSVLIQDARPAIYPYFQEYEVDQERKVRRGFIALLDLKRAGSAIRPHERTMAEPKMDRLRLMRSTESNEDLIFMLYKDESLEIDRLLTDRASTSPAEIDVIDDFGARHRVWSITDPVAIKKISDAMAQHELFIADGHHRFETSINYMHECDARGWHPAGVESFTGRLIACFNSADQEITILPTHRLIRDLARFQSQTFLKEAERYFAVERLASAKNLWEKMRQSRDEAHVFGFYPRDVRRFFLLRLKDEALVDPLMLSHPEPFRRLDISILHTIVLDRLLGIDEAKLVDQAHVDYARDREACIRRVDEGQYQAALFVNPTNVEQVQRVALLSERMPQKSTDFYPKLLTGLLLMKMSIEKG